MIGGRPAQHTVETVRLGFASAKPMNPKEVTDNAQGDELDRASTLKAFYETLKRQYDTSYSMDDLSNIFAFLLQTLEDSSVDGSMRPFWLRNLGQALRERSTRATSTEDLDDAISKFEEALELLPPESLERGNLLQELAISLQCRFKQGQNMRDINRAVSIIAESIADSTIERDRAYRLWDKGNMLKARAYRTHSISDLDEAIVAYDKAVSSIDKIDNAEILNDLGDAMEFKYDLTKSLDHLRDLVDVRRDCVDWLTNGYYDMGIYWDEFSTVLQMLFERTGSLDDINEAIAASREAIELAYDNNDSAQYLYNLGIALRQKARRTWCTDDFDEAVKASADALNTAPPDHPSRSTFLSNYGTALADRFYRLGRAADINRAVEAHENAVASSGGCVTDRALSLNSLSVALLSRYSEEGPIGDLDRAITVSEEAVRISTNDSSRLHYIETLSSCLLSRSARLGDLKDLERGTAFAREAVNSNRQENGDRARGLELLGLAMLGNFERTMSTDDINQSVEAFTAAVRLTEDEEYPDNIRNRTNLANALQRRFFISASIDDLDKATELRKGIVKATPDDDPRAAGHKVNLANAVEERYWQAGSMVDLNEAIQIHQWVIASIDEHHPNRAFVLFGLGRCLENRYLRVGSLHDLNSAIVAVESALQTVSDDTAKRAMYLGQFGNLLNQRCYHTGSIEDNSKGIEALRKSVESTPQEFIGRGTRCMHLGQSLWRRYQLISSPDDLNEAVACIQQAIDCQPPTSIRRHLSLLNLVACLYERFRLTGSWKDLQDRFRYSEEAAQLMPKGHPDRAASLLNLITALEDIFGEADSMDRMISLALEAAEETSASIEIRIQVAQRTGKLYLASANLERASHFFTVAVSLLPEVSPRSLARSDQQRKLAMYSSITSYAAAIMLEFSGRSVEALRLLEIGRGVLASLQLDTRTEVTDLELMHPQLAQEFRSLQEELDSELQLESEFSDLETATIISAQINRRHNSVRRMSSLVQEIRSLEGFDRFLVGPTDTELLALASHGPIAVFNIAECRCDALLITSNNITCLPLPDLHSNDIADYAQDLLMLLDSLKLSTYNETNEFLTELLEWLWDVAVGPVLNALGLREPHVEGQPWTHIWWVASGWLNLLPIHAAGYYGDCTRNALDRVISCYIPTLKALSVVRNKAMSSQPQSMEVLFVSMPHTPEREELAYVTDEIAEINSILPMSISRSILEMPGKAEVKEKMERSQLVHFACHGTSNVDDPSKSHLLLSDWQEDLFSVTDIIAMRVTEPRLIYLSACQVAQARIETLLDESIHLAGACQLAGFAHVIGSLWTINDYTSPMVAKGVYNGILTEDNTLHLGRSAEALHNSVRKLRSTIMDIDGIHRELVEDPLRWASYIYLGA